MIQQNRLGASSEEVGVDRHASSRGRVSKEEVVELIADLEKVTSGVDVVKQ